MLKENEVPSQTAAMNAEGNGADIEMVKPAVIRPPPAFVTTILEFAQQNRMLFAAGVVLLVSAMALTVSPLGQKLSAKLILAFQRVIARPAEVLSVVLPESHGPKAGFIQTIWLLLMSVVMVPTVCRVLPGATPVLGFLVLEM